MEKMFNLKPKAKEFEERTLIGRQGLPYHDNVKK